MFIGNDDAGDVNAVFVSLLASCQLHGIELWSYLRDLFACSVLAATTRPRLAPARWRTTLEEPETQRLLGDNVFRRATFVAAPG